MSSGDQEASDSYAELDSFNSSHAASSTTTVETKRARHRFSAWTFQLTLSADATALNGGRASISVTLRERQKVSAWAHPSSLPSYNARNCYLR
jgi:hypothetical protein